MNIFVPYSWSNVVSFGLGSSPPLSFQAIPCDSTSEAKAATPFTAEQHVWTFTNQTHGQASRGEHPSKHPILGYQCFGHLVGRHCTHTHLICCSAPVTVPSGLHSLKSQHNWRYLHGRWCPGPIQIRHSHSALWMACNIVFE